ncbi:hypothetical protein EKO27_g9357 [Xylaria grammica]|uniref:Uncharacterized protein n=1 Tax=Xylaria grammica TaxID=363999 RepID=A0A439CUB4_9PEZI|nr:hypothetical protein EKO27_g9357 [Xylaria grammica]
MPLYPEYLERALSNTMHFQQAIPKELLSAPNLGAPPSLGRMDRKDKKPVLLVLAVLLALPVFQAIGESRGMRPALATLFALVMASIPAFVSSAKAAF